MRRRQLIALLFNYFFCFSFYFPGQMTLTFSASLTEIYEYPSFESASPDVGGSGATWKEEASHSQQGASGLKANSSIGLKNGGEEGRNGRTAVALRRPVSFLCIQPIEINLCDSAFDLTVKGKKKRKKEFYTHVDFAYKEF